MSEKEFEGGRRTRENKDLVLAPGQYAYMQDVTKGRVRVLVGPTVFSPTAQDQPVVYKMKGNRPFEPVDIDTAVQKNAIAVEGYYLQLLNPAKDGKTPAEGKNDETPVLEVGRKVNIPGPVMFPLWPGQSVEMIKGHQLRSNQYLLVRIYNEEEARRNWTRAVIKPAGDGVEQTPVATGSAPSDMTVGKQYIIKGTEVSFYIPPTGVSVVRDEETGNYVREALTLERLEYTILVDEGGDKRYEKGPAVVFPEPDETFIVSPKGDKKFRAIELNEIQGIYVKVIADYEEGDRKYAAGEELFITGKDTPIYYPREEHSLIRYDGKTKHFATAIPVGEGRYVMDRMTGEIKVAEGPAMVLPDPRAEVFVHRVLTDRECSLWYPGNVEALEFNRNLRALQSATPTTRNAISEGDLARAYKGGSSKGGGRAMALASDTAFMESSVLGNSAQSFVADEFSRASSYTQPRAITLNTKYNGVPLVLPHTGFAVMVVGAGGTRRVVTGPARILVGYDESLEVLTLSTGKPKTMDKPYETVYLRVKNNKVSDYVVVESSDHVKVELKLSFRVDFEGETAEERNKWFEVENYVKFLTDHVRSVLSGAARKHSIADLYMNATDFVRNTILGPRSADGRTGMRFTENNMRVNDVEVLHVAIQDQSIAQLILSEQNAVVSENISIEREQRKLAFTQKHQDIKRQIAQANFDTAEFENQLAVQRAASEFAVVVAKLENEVKQAAEAAKVNEALAGAQNVLHRAQLGREAETAQQALQFEARKQELRLQALMAEAEATVKKVEQFGPQFTQALIQLSSDDTMAKVAEALSAQQLFGGASVAEVLQKVFAGTGLEKYMRDRVIEARPTNGNGSGTVGVTPKQPHV